MYIEQHLLLLRWRGEERESIQNPILFLHVMSPGFDFDFDSDCPVLSAAGFPMVRIKSLFPTCWVQC